MWNEELENLLKYWEETPRPERRSPHIGFVVATGIATFLGGFLIRDKNGVALTQHFGDWLGPPVTSEHPTWLPFLTQRENHNLTSAIVTATATAVVAYLLDRDMGRKSADTHDELLSELRAMKEAHEQQLAKQDAIQRS